jgi:hypothetical protein
MTSPRLPSERANNSLFIEGYRGWVWVCVNCNPNSPDWWLDLQCARTPFPWSWGSSWTSLADICHSWLTHGLSPPALSTPGTYGAASWGVALTCMLFHAASPRPRTQLSSLSGEPRAPCFVSAHSPVPTLRIWEGKRAGVNHKVPQHTHGASAWVEGEPRQR